MARGYGIDSGFKLEGADDLDRLLRDLPRKIQTRAISSAVSAGATVLRKEAARNAPYDFNRSYGYHIKNEIIKKKVRGTNDIWMVGASTNVPHAHLIEFGTGPRFLKKPRRVMLQGRWVRVEETGRVTPRPFLRTALRTKGGEAIEKILIKMRKNIFKESEKLAAHYGTRR